MTKELGRRVWAFPDGELPETGSNGESGHESLLLLNLMPLPTRVSITIYFDNQPPERDLTLVVEGERVRCVRLNEPVGEQQFRIPSGQYALLIESEQPVIAQIGRMDVRQPNLAYYTVIGFPLDG